MNKNDLRRADRVTSGVYTSQKQWGRDVAIAIQRGLVVQEMDVGGPRFVVTQKYIDLSDKEYPDETLI